MQIKMSVKQLKKARPGSLGDVYGDLIQPSHMAFIIYWLPTFLMFVNIHDPSCHNPTSYT